MIELTKTVKRRMQCKRIRRPLIVQLEPEGILKLKEKGSRKWYTICLESLYFRLVKAERR